METPGLTFGIYPLSAAGTPFGIAEGPADDIGKIQRALQDLRGESATLLPRLYLIYSDEWESKMLSNAKRYFEAGLLGDLVVGCGDWVQHHEPEFKLNKWLDFIREIIGTYGSHLASLQITNEPNLSFMEGSKPYMMEAMIEGVIAAKRETELRKLSIKIGFGSVPESQASVPDFWDNVSKFGGTTFIKAIDFVGHNFYVDVFEERPVALKDVPASVERILRDLREIHFVHAGIPSSVAIRVTENGWPTGKNPITGMQRPYAHQAEVLETVIRTTYDLRQCLNVSHFELFGLRDADSSREELFYQYGIMTDDYSPKPAYYTFKELIRQLS